MNKRIFQISLASIWSIYGCICLIFCILGKNPNWLNVFLPLTFYLIILFKNSKFNKSDKFLAWVWTFCLITDVISYIIGYNPNWILVFCPFYCLILRLWEFVIFNNEKRNV